ncbi:helix-turn-helix domain-containing protein [Nocardia vaccinii]|uniref:helix-turn-helix domain-containing protein n=1 Tax=Nocardia vaccinii TaxID=1822 RepID=UPI0008306152|nr:helix-turn-helix domain-containing protein [Nocardia vaccinii]
MKSARAPYTPLPSHNRRSLDLERLVDIAVEPFLQRGYDGTSMADIPAAAGARKSTLYHHVRGKEELLRSGSQRSLIAYSAMLEEPEATVLSDAA